MPSSNVSETAPSILSGQKLLIDNLEDSPYANYVAEATVAQSMLDRRRRLKEVNPEDKSKVMDGLEWVLVEGDAIEEFNQTCQQGIPGPDHSEATGIHPLLEDFRTDS
jgi:hypothetical protein